MCKIYSLQFCHKSRWKSKCKKKKKWKSTYPESLADLFGDGIFRAQHRMATQFMLQFATFVPIDPAENSGIIFWWTAIRDAIGPIFGQSMLSRSRLQSWRTHEYSHRNIGLIDLCVISPKCGQGLFNAIVTCFEFQLIQLAKFHVKVGRHRRYSRWLQSTLKYHFSSF